MLFYLKFNLNYELKIRFLFAFKKCELNLFKVYFLFKFEKILLYWTQLNALQEST